MFNNNKVANIKQMVIAIINQTFPWKGLVAAKNESLGFGLRN